MDLYLKTILQKNRPISAKNAMAQLEKVLCINLPKKRVKKAKNFRKNQKFPFLNKFIIQNEHIVTNDT